MIRLTLSLLLGVIMVAASAARAAGAADGAVPVATYIEVAPRSTGVALAAIEAEAGASRRDDGCRAARGC